jgi:hypothetical protein
MGATVVGSPAPDAVYPNFAPDAAPTLGPRPPTRNAPSRVTRCAQLVPRLVTRSTVDRRGSVAPTPWLA